VEGRMSGNDEKKAAKEKKDRLDKLKEINKVLDELDKAIEKASKPPPGKREDLKRDAFVKASEIETLKDEFMELLPDVLGKKFRRWYMDLKDIDSEIEVIKQRLIRAGAVERPETLKIRIEWIKKMKEEFEKWIKEAK
jgi:hypothetical protein